MAQDQKPGKAKKKITLKQRVMRATGFNTLGIVMRYSFNFISNLALTWLLVPEAFGLMAMVMILHTGLKLFSDIGLKQSVVRSERGEEPHYLRVAWTIQVLRGVAIGFIVFLVGIATIWLGDFAPADSVYADPMLPGMLMISSLVPVAQSAQTANLWVAERRMIQGRVLVYAFVARSIGLSATIAMALIFRSAWALAIGLVIGQVCRMALSHVMIPGPKMWFVRDPALSKELWAFGRWILVSSIFGFFGQNADRIILGGILDTKTFGFYVVALVWVNAAGALSRQLVSGISLAVFSQVLREQPERLRRVYFKFSWRHDVLAIVATLAVLVVAPFLIHTLYKPDYAVAATMLPYLCLRVLVQRFVLSNTLILAHGDSAQMMIASGLRAIASGVFLIVGNALFGIAGALVGAALVPLAATPFNLYKVARYGAGVIWYDVIWLVVILGLAGLLVTGVIGQGLAI